ncbi:MAG: butyrate kinase [Thermodesulfobacteriota bacterium]|nr:butyrate kinase [Thermodesulfobacteriota bacterium]
MSYILVINIGSTSTRVGMFRDNAPVFTETVNHFSGKTAELKDFSDWYTFNLGVVDEILGRYRNKITDLHLVVSRGGLTRPVKTGAYLINQSMIDDLASGRYGWHPCNTGPVIAREIASRYKTKAIIFDSPVSDEMIPVARFSGFKGIERCAAFHVLSQKSAAKQASDNLKISYSKSSFIVVHMGGGITICAHKNGRMIDGTHGINEGPFTPQRSGILPLQEIIQLCFSGRYSRQELHQTLFGNGGVASYLGTHDVKQLEEKISKGDTKVRQVLEAMGYQISKEIGSMTTVLNGHVDAIVITGSLSHAKTIMKEIQNRISFIARVLIFPDEDELATLAAGGTFVINQNEAIQTYIKE